MTTSFDRTFVPLALRLINQSGTDAIFDVPTGTGTGYDRTTGSVNNPTAPVTRKVTPPSAVKLGMIDGDVVQVGDMQCLVAASGLTFTPERSMTVTVAGQTWTIQMVQPLQSGDEIAAYKLFMRGK